MEENMTIKSILNCSCLGNCVQLTIGDHWYSISAGAGEENTYKIEILECSNDDDEDYYIVEKSIYKHLIELSKEEYEAASKFPFEDVEFITHIDEMLAAKVAKDFLNYCLKNITATLYYTDTMNGKNFNFEKNERKWEKYFKKLLHKRMNGEAISPYIPGYEPR